MANKVLSRIKRNCLLIKFPSLKNLNKISLKCFSDASLNNLSSGNSCGGFIIFLVGENRESCPISWKSKSVKRVVRSAIASEACVAVDALDCSYYLSYLLNEILKNDTGIPVDAYVDNKSLYLNVHSTTMVDERRLRIDISAIQEMINKNEIRNFNWISTKMQLADTLTKRGSNPANLTRVLENGSLY